MKYCTMCGKNVNPTSVKKKTCPICHGHQLQGAREAIDRENGTPIQMKLSQPKVWANKPEQSGNDSHKQKLSMRQKLLQQSLKSVEHSQELKNVAEFQVRCEAATASRMLAVEQRKLERKQKRAMRMRVYHLNEEILEQGI